MHRIRAVWLLLAAVVAGCSDELPQPVADVVTPAPEPVAVPSQFDATTAGIIRGRVLWTGPIPRVAPFEIRSLVTDSSAKAQPRLLRDNPHAPVIDAASRGVEGAVVFLRGVDPRKARPWDHAEVVVEHSDRDLHIVQGPAKSRIGFVRQGDAITMVSREPVLNALRARGAAWFTLMFPEADQPLSRPLGDKGIVELRSGVGYYWMHGTLFVDDHPYYVRTNAHGGFELSLVPPGRYELVCWMPNWNQAGKDRDPESALVVRVTFQPPLELVQEVVVEDGAEKRVDFSVAATMFEQ